MSRKITNNTGYTLYRYGTTDYKTNPTGRGYEVKNNTTTTIETENVFCVASNSDLLSIKTTSGLILTKQKNLVGTLEVYNSSTGDYDDISVVPFDNYFGPSSADTTLTLVQREAVTTHSIITRLSHCTITPTDTTIEDNTSVTFTVTADSGYWFYSIPTINGNNMTKVSDTEYTSTITVLSDVTIIATAIKQAQTENITRHMQNASVSPTSFTVGTATLFTITADDGYSIVTAYATYLIENGDTEQVNFTIADDKVKATATITVPDDGLSSHSLNIYNTATQAPITKVLNDLIAIYLPTEEELGKISEKQFINAEGQVYKISDFITSYKKLYIPKDWVNIVGKNYVVLGYYDTKIESDVTNSYMLSKMSETFKFPKKHNNSYDYTDTKYQLYLPFIGLVDLDSSVCDLDLTLQVVVNIITADIKYLIWNIKSPVQRILFAEFTGKCGFDVPYKTSDILWSLYNKDSAITGTFDVNIRYPMKQITFHKELSTSNNVYNTQQWVNLADITGYTQFSDVDLTNITNATFTEKDELETILEKGVFL